MRMRSSEEQIIEILSESQNGAIARDMCKMLNGSEQAFYRWRTRNRYSGMPMNEAKRLREPERENFELNTTIDQFGGADL